MINGILLYNDIFHELFVYFLDVENQRYCRQFVSNDITNHKKTSHDELCHDYVTNARQ